LNFWIFNTAWPF